MPLWIRVLLCTCLSGVVLGAPRAHADEADEGDGARGEEAFAKASARLKSPDSAERAGAADEMGLRGYRLRSEVAVVLRPLLADDPAPIVRAAAGRALGRLGVRDAVPDLVRALRDPSPDVRVVAAAALWRLPDVAAVGALLERVGDSEGAVREWSVLALGVIGDRRAVPDMIRLLSDPERGVRLAAVRSLGRIGDPEGMKPLLAYLSSGNRDEEEKGEVVNSLASLEGPDKVNALVSLLDTVETDETQKIRLIAALRQVGDALAISPLRRHTVDSETASVRSAAAEAIAAVQARAAGQEAAAGP